MSAVTESNLGLNYGWAYGESGWNTGMDDNLVKLGFTSRNQVKGILSAPPSTPSNGDAYIVGTSPTGLFSGNFGKVAIWDRTVWLFLTPKNHEVVYNIANGCDYKYDNGWVLKQEAELSPYVKVKDFTFSTGYTVTDQKQCLLNLADNKYYQWFGSLPKVVAVGSTPATSGGIGAGAWVDRTQETLRSELFGPNAPLVAPTLSDTYLASWLDTTGATDHTSDIAELFTKYNCVKLPDTGSGFIRADITVPQGCTLLGYGPKLFNETTNSWYGKGSHIVGTISQTGVRGFVLGNFSVDNYASGGNAIVGLSAATGDGYIKNVNSRANNHCQLWEANSVGDAANSNAVGNIVIEDCNAYSGPNGFVTKHRNVKFIRCKSYTQSVQGFVVASDNINGATTYSRAIDTLLEDCQSFSANESVRIYARDYGSTGLVLGVSNTTIIRHSGNGTVGRVIRTGDFAAVATTYTRVRNYDLKIEGLPYIVTPFSCHRIENFERVTFSKCVWGGQDNVTAGDECRFLRFSPDCQPINGSTPTGLESGFFVENTNSATVLPVPKSRYILVQNTATTTITNIGYAAKGDEVIIHIDDLFTTVNITGIVHKGKGCIVKAFYTGTSWQDNGETRQRGETEFSAGSGATAAFSLTAGQLNQLWDSNGASISSIAITNFTNLAAGEIVTLHIVNNTANSVALSGWNSQFKWPDTTSSPTAIDNFRKLLLRCYHVGSGNFVVFSQTKYV